MRLAVIGLGRMGRAVIAEAERRAHEVTVRIGGGENRHQEALTADRLAGIEMAIEFSRPEAAPANLERLIELGIPVVAGTTGWSSHLPRLTELARGRSGALLHAPHFALGVQLMLRAAAELARLIRGLPGFDAAILEQHHRQKVDAPSGTALLLQRSLHDCDPDRAYPITSQRVGSVPGTHSLHLDAETESLVLTHVVRDRRVFAAGALTAAEWLRGRTGVFTFEQVFEGGAR
jgi:4-hydroxy-tetrahydrodipicolinate reductase